MPAKDELVVDILWDFSLTAPKKSAFLAAVRDYQTEITSDMPWWLRAIYCIAHRGDLSKAFGSKSVALAYEYATETDTGKWVNHQETLTIESLDTVTIGDALYALHHQTNGNLASGLESSVTLEAFEKVSSEKDGNNLTPKYEVFFGD